MVDLLQYLGGSVESSLSRAAGQLMGEPEARTRSAVSTLLPAALAACTRKASTASGAAALFDKLNDPSIPTGMPDVASLVSGDARSEGPLRSGRSLSAFLLGDRTSALERTVASRSGLKPSSVTTLLAMIVPLILAFLKGRVREGRLDAAGLGKLLVGQRGTLASRLDPSLTQALGFATPGAFLADETADELAATGRRTVAATRDEVLEPVREVRTRRSGFPGWLPWLAAAVLAGLVIFALLRRGGREDRIDETVAARTTPAGERVAGSLRTVELPGGRTIEVREGGFTARLVDYLNGRDAGSAGGFAFDEVNFETGSARLTGDSRRQLEQLAAVLEAYPDVSIRVDGHTDAAGDAAANRTLSQQRADAVKSTIVQMGVPSERVVAQGHGQEQPIASNDTEAGRAQNRRVEVVVTGR